MDNYEQAFDPERPLDLGSCHHKPGQTIKHAEINEARTSIMSVVVGDQVRLQRTYIQQPHIQQTLALTPLPSWSGLQHCRATIVMPSHDSLNVKIITTEGARPSYSMSERKDCMTTVIDREVSAIERPIERNETEKQRHQAQLEEDMAATLRRMVSDPNTSGKRSMDHDEERSLNNREDLKRQRR